MIVLMQILSLSIRHIVIVTQLDHAPSTISPERCRNGDETGAYGDY